MWESQTSQMSMMMKTALSVTLLLLLPHCVLCGGAGDVQETRALQQDNNVQEVMAREKREDSENICGDNTEKVVFGAALGPQTNEGNCGPFDKDIILVYKVVYANVGNAYSPTTGIFTAPVKGVYYFSFTGNSKSTKTMGLMLIKNNKHMVSVFNKATGRGYETSTNGMYLELEKGDQVYMKLLANNWLFDNGGGYSTFIGQLLFPLYN